MTVEPDGGGAPSAEDRSGAGSEVVVRPDVRAVTLQAVSRGATVLRTTIPELARRPAVVAALAATATVGTRLAVRVAAELIQSQQRSRATTASVQVAVAPVEVVVHHVVHHVVHPVSVPPRPPWPITPGW
jgi:hypothetical protein